MQGQDVRKADLHFVNAYMSKRFPARTKEEVADAIEVVLARMAPSRARTRLMRETVKLLNGPDEVA